MAFDIYFKDLQKKIYGETATRLIRYDSLYVCAEMRFLLKNK